MNILYDIFGVPFGFLMSIIYNWCGNYAIAIIVFTIVTKLLLFPINYKTQKNSARMQLLNPKLEKLRKSFANNPQRFQEEQQKLYQQEGYNPMESCMPALIQMLLLFGVIDVIYKPFTHILRIAKSVRTAATEITSGLIGKTISTGNLRSELLTLEQVDKSPESYQDLSDNFLQSVTEFSQNFTIFGANLGKTPEFHPETWTKEALILFLIPFAAGVAQFISSLYMQIHQKKTNPTAAQAGGCMNVAMLLMPIWSVMIAFSVPAGIGFYWIWSSLFSFLITFALNQYFTPERIKVINEKEKEKARIYAEKHPEKKTFMQKMMEQQALYDQQQNGSGLPRTGAGGEKLSRSEANKQNRERINEARRRMAEKYGDVYDENESDDD